MHGLVPEPYIKMEDWINNGFTDELAELVMSDINKGTHVGKNTKCTPA